MLRTIDNLVEDEYKFYINNVEWSTLKENLQLSRDRNFVKILANVKDDVNFCDIPEVIDKSKSAFFDEDVAISYRVIRSIYLLYYITALFIIQGEI